MLHFLLPNGVKIADSHFAATFLFAEQRGAPCESRLLEWEACLPHGLRERSREVVVIR